MQSTVNDIQVMGGSTRLQSFDNVFGACKCTGPGAEDSHKEARYYVTVSLDIFHDTDQSWAYCQHCLLQHER